MCVFSLPALCCRGAHTRTDTHRQAHTERGRARERERTHRSRDAAGGFSRFGDGVEESKMDGGAPIHTSIPPLELNEQCLDSCFLHERTQRNIHLRIIRITAYRIDFQTFPFYPLDSPLCAQQSTTFQCSVLLTLLNNFYWFCLLLCEVAILKTCLAEPQKDTQMKQTYKQMRGDKMGEGTDEVDGSKTTRISLSFPISAGLPGFSAEKHRSMIHTPASSITFDRDALNTIAWKEESHREKQTPKAAKSDHLSCTSSTRTTDSTAPVSKNCKSSVKSFSVAGSGSHFPASALHTSAKMDFSRDTSGTSASNDYPEHSTTETAHILFNLSARAYQSQVTKDTEISKGKKRKGNSLHVELSLPLPSINPPSSSTSPPPLSSSSVSPLTLSTSSFHDSYKAVPKPELLCGVCHRLFSTASSLTVHMRLHRGGRLLSCRHCGKVFIHNKRLQSHEATCRQALPAFPVQPKEEPLEEGEVDVSAKAAEPEQIGIDGEPDHPIKKSRGLHGHHARTLSESEGLRGEDHFVKVVDGHIIYFCSVCERSYMTLSSLKRHSNVHSWRRKYPCHYCDKVFALAEYRTKHEVWHTGERRYQCIFCWEAFPTYYNLKTHQKAFHGISPGLISSEKTANGGYKQKVNALKLYRLLPMRSQKRPYKTYNQALAEGLFKTDPSINSTLGCTIPSALNPDELESFLKDLHPQGIKPDPDKLLVNLDSEQGRNQTSPYIDLPEACEMEGPDLHSSCSSSGNAETPRDSEAAVSSVITFGRSKQSVIMHGTALPSSVIVQRDKSPSGDENTPHENSQAIDKTLQKSFGKHSQKEHTHAHSRWNTISTEVSKVQKRKEKLHKARKKNASSKVVPISVDSEVKGSGPLCQITVRIGEEAIVKRSISETDLMRDKSSSLRKEKKSHCLQGDQREQRRSHPHRKHHSHCSSKQDTRKREMKWKNSRPAGKYFFRQEVREERNDQDGEDNLWRPYYSYKPKRKAMHLQKIKSWQRKMHYKRSLRLMKRAERLMNHVNKKDENLTEQQKEDIEEKEKEDITQITEMEEEKQEATEKPDPSFSAALSQPISTQHTVSSTVKQQWSGDQACQCGSCGRWFSSSRKRDKHELTHLFEFVCLHCRAPFPSQTKLEEHQRLSHPKNKPTSTSAPCNSESSNKETAIEQEESGNASNWRFLDKGSPVRLGRRPLTRYTCSQCDKVCKTAAALNCHMKRHELGITPETLQQIQDVSHNSGVTAVDSIRRKESDILERQAQPIAVINYPKTTSQHRTSQASESSEGDQRVGTYECPKLATDKLQISQMSIASSPVRVSPTPEQSKVVSPRVPSVLVMNSSECLDFRSPEKKSLDAQDQRKCITPTDRQGQVGKVQTSSKLKTDADTAIPTTLQHVKVNHVQVDRGLLKQRDVRSSEPLRRSPEVQDLRIPRAACSLQAEDLSMQTILARERELTHQVPYQHTSNKSRATEEVMLKVPKEEPLSPVPSPTCSVIQTTQKRPIQMHSQSPCHSPAPLNLQLRPHYESHQAHKGMHSSEKQRSKLPSSNQGIKFASSHAAMHPQMPHSVPEIKDSNSSAARDPCRESVCPVQDFALPLILPGGFCSGKKQEDQFLMSYPPTPLSFGALGKMVPHTDSTKLPFYPDPYQLLYGPQLLPYPYNLAALPMALNMMGSGDKVEPLPFLPTLYNYAAVGAPFPGTVPHPLVINPSLYNSSRSTKQDGDNS